MEKILYFPYVNVPGDRWTIKTLLYWDEIATISPVHATYEWESSDSISGILYRAGILTSFDPGEFFADVNLLSKTEQLINELDLHEYQNALESSFTSNLVYSQKWPDDVFAMLIKSGLARRRGEDFIVEKRIANTLMLELAQIIASENGIIPSTDTAVFANGECLPQSVSDKIRTKFLNRLLPCPTNPNIDKLMRFRQEHHDTMKSFRKELEKEVFHTDKMLSTEELMDYSVGFRSSQIAAETRRIQKIIQDDLDDKASKTALDFFFTLFGAIASKGTSLIPIALQKVFGRLRPERNKTTIQDMPYYYLVLLESQANFQ